MKNRLKYRSRSLLVLASAVLIILLNFYGCAPQTAPPTNQPEALSSKPLDQLKEQPKEQPKASEKQANVTVKIRNFKYEPAILKINADETVKFINEDEEPHTATAENGSFDSKALDTNQAFTYTFTKAGSYPYICAIHPFMKGSITVTAKGEK
jgi:plastocyanin